MYDEFQVLISVCCFAETSTPTTNLNRSSSDRPARASHRAWMFTVRTLRHLHHDTDVNTHMQLVIVPYILGGGMFALSLVIGLKDRSTVTRAPGGFYCGMINTLPLVSLDLLYLCTDFYRPFRGKTSAIVVAVVMIICVCLCATIAIVLRRNWSIFSKETTGTPLSTVMRVLVFTLFSMVAVV